MTSIWGIKNLSHGLKKLADFITIKGSIYLAVHSFLLVHLLESLHFIFLTSKSRGAIYDSPFFIFRKFQTGGIFGGPVKGGEFHHRCFPRPERWYRPRPRILIRKMWSWQTSTTKFRVRNWSTASLGCLGSL